MLKQRIPTALFIALGAFALLFLVPPAGFRLAMAALLLTGTWEFTRLAGLGRIPAWILMGVQTIVLLLMILFWSTISNHGMTFLSAAVLTWLVMFLRLITYRPGVEPGINYRLISFFCALASISFAWYSLSWLRNQAQGEYLLLLLLFIIWAADTGAYFAGKQFGQRKLAPSISPGKTWEGLFGGIGTALLIALLLAHYTIGLPGTLLWFIVLIVVTALTSAAGDLFISLHKRTMGLKDAGKLFPGHGGVLDRFDSLVAGAPFFALGMYFFGS
jgi:phosphatidate cytidylyltransferase